MDVAFPRRSQATRLLLGGALLGAAFAVTSLFLSDSSASADERDEGSGLLGAVGQTVSEVTDVVDKTTDALDKTVEKVVEPVAEKVVEPAVEPLPEPVKEPVAQTVDVVVDNVTETVDAVDDTVTGTVDEALDTVSDVADAGVVTEVVEPVTEVVDEVPVVGTVVEGTGVDDALTSVADTLDSTVSTVVGRADTVGSSTGEGILPDLPTTGVDTILDTVAPGTTEAPDPSWPGVDPIDGSDPSIPLPDTASGSSSAPDAAIDGAAAIDPSGGTASGALARLLTGEDSVYSVDGAVAPGGPVDPTGAHVADPRDATSPGSGPSVPGTCSGGVAAAGSAGSGGTAALSTGSDPLPLSLLGVTVPADDDLGDSPFFDTDVSPD